MYKAIDRELFAWAARHGLPAFTTTAGSHTLKFVGLNSGGQAGFIDHVRITGSPVIGNGVQWLVADHLGTPRMLLDESGSLGGVKRHDYLPFGEDLFGGTGRPTFYRKTNDQRTPAEKQRQAERVRTHNKANTRIGIEIERQIGPPPPRLKKGKKGANEAQT